MVHVHIRQHWRGADNSFSHDSSTPAPLYHHLAGLNTVQRSPRTDSFFHREQLVPGVRHSRTNFKMYLLSLNKCLTPLNKYNNSCCNNWLLFHHVGLLIVIHLVRKVASCCKTRRLNKIILILYIPLSIHRLPTSEDWDFLTKIFHAFLFYPRVSRLIFHYLIAFTALDKDHKI